MNKLGYLIDELALGPKKYNGVCRHRFSGIARRIDIMYTTPEEYPFAILYFTGSKEYNQKINVVGSGSNLLVSDNGVRGIIICIKDCLKSLKVEDNKIYAECGIMLG